MFDVHTGCRHHAIRLQVHAARLDGEGAGAQGEQEPKRDHRYLPKRPAYHDTQALAPNRASIKAQSVDPRATIKNAAANSHNILVPNRRNAGALGRPRVVSFPEQVYTFRTFGEVIAALEAAGFQIDRINPSHVDGRSVPWPRPCERANGFLSNREASTWLCRRRKLSAARRAEPPLPVRNLQQES